MLAQSGTPRARSGGGRRRRLGTALNTGVHSRTLHAPVPRQPEQEEDVIRGTFALLSGLRCLPES